MTIEHAICTSVSHACRTAIFCLSFALIGCPLLASAWGQDTLSNDALANSTRSAADTTQANERGSLVQPQDEMDESSDKTRIQTWTKLKTAALLTSAYEAANRALTQSELESVLEKCGELRQRELAEDQLRHTIRLSAWSRFRIAELLIDQTSREYLLSLRTPKKASSDDDDAKSVQDDEFAESESLTRKAIDLYTAAFEDDPTLLEAKFGLGVAHAMLGEYQVAEAIFAFVAESNPADAESHFNRAECLSYLGKYDASITSYDAVLKLRPQDPASYAGRAHAHLALGAIDRALMDYKRCVQMQPNDARALINRGDAYLRQGKWEQALDDYISARGEEPSLAIPCQRMAWVMATCPNLKLRNESGAYELAIEAIQLNGGADAILMDTLAAAQAANGWFEDAKSTLEQAKKLDPAGFDDQTARRLELYQAERPYVDQAKIR